MKYRPLGSTGLQVSEVCLGTWQLSGQWAEDVEPAVQAISRAVDLGINFFDTAYAYGAGLAETGLARGLGDHLKSRRSDLVISTKGGLEFSNGGVVRNSDPAWLRTTLEHSLQALGTDYVDVYFVHWPDPLEDFEEVGAALKGFVNDGLVRFAGVSNFDVSEMTAFQRGGPIDVAQPPFSLLRREAETDVLPRCNQQGIGVMGYGALAHGLLSGALQPGQSFADWRSGIALFQGEDFARIMDGVGRLSAVAEECGCTLAQLAIAWVLAHPAGVIPVIGAEKPGHLEDSVKAVDVRLTPEDFQKLRSIAEAMPMADPAVDIPNRTA